ncbi:MAG: hypothetical protein LBT98_04470 [Puniceicoccales bacterium]|jgi:hypothetical protein|nr:hypothetical protein [Puniceicoccales bacterium]
MSKVNNSTHLISVLNVTTGISAVLTALSLVGAIVTVTLIFAASLPVLWPVLIGCACATVIGLIVFLSVRYASSRCKVPTEENFPKNDLPIVIKNENENSGPPFDENEFKYNPNIGDPLEEIPSGNVEAAISDPSNPHFPAMVRNCVRILSQMNNDITVENALKFLAKEYNILLSYNDMLAASWILSAKLTTSNSIKDLNQHFDNNEFNELSMHYSYEIKLLSFLVAIRTLFQNHGIYIRTYVNDYTITPFCPDDPISLESNPVYFAVNCSGSQVTPENFYQMTRRNAISDSNVLCVHYDSNGHIQIDKPPERNE